MELKTTTITACVVIHNEESLMERCLSSLMNYVDEIIVVHDGECLDKSLEIAAKYTNKIFIREHVGCMEPHLAFAYNQAKSDYVLRIDADEFIDQETFIKLKEIIKDSPNEVGAYSLFWEFWDGKNILHNKAIKKVCLNKKSHLHFLGVMHQIGKVDGKIIQLNLFLRHRPRYNNMSWESFFNKMKRHIPVHIKFFFMSPESYECFNISVDNWLDYVKKVKARPLWFLLSYPIKTCLAQLKNGLIFNWIGINIAIQQGIYYFCLYYKIWRLTKKIK